MRVISHNVNGIRAAVRRGLLERIVALDPDVLCLQEVRAREVDLPAEFLDLIARTGRVLSYAPGDRAGRNGVAVVTREQPTAVREGLAGGAGEFDAHGRYLEVDLPGLTVASLYLPKGARDGELLETKLRFTAALSDAVWRARLRDGAAREFLLCGDFNIAQDENDIRAWRTNLRSPGFLPVERSWLGSLSREQGLVDLVRAHHGAVPGPYSWWSWRGKAFDNDAGWRIDHQLATAGLAARMVSATVDRESSYAARISDHAAVIADFDDPS
nr:exodeoxyribonuclease III [Nakamurella flavida]